MLHSQDNWNKVHFIRAHVGTIMRKTLHNPGCGAFIHAFIHFIVYPCMNTCMLSSSINVFIRSDVDLSFCAKNVNYRDRSSFWQCQFIHSFNIFFTEWLGSAKDYSRTRVSK